MSPYFSSTHYIITLCSRLIIKCPGGSGVVATPRRSNINVQLGMAPHKLSGSGAGGTTELGASSTAERRPGDPQFLGAFSGQAACCTSKPQLPPPDASPSPFAPKLCRLSRHCAFDVPPRPTTSDPDRRARDCGARLGMTVDTSAHSPVPLRRNT